MRPEQMVFIGNFKHTDRLICNDIKSEIAAVLDDYGWQNEFAIYYHEYDPEIRLYLRMAYMGGFYLDGSWEEIKSRLPYIIPLLLAATELRREKGAIVMWTERNLKDLHWFKPEDVIAETKTE